MTAQIVHHHDVAWTQIRYQELFDPGQKTLAIDGAVEHAWRDDAVTAKTRNEGECLAMTVRHLRDQSPASGTASMQSGHVCLRPGFIDEDQPSGGDLVLVLLPSTPSARDVGAILFAGVQTFF